MALNLTEIGQITLRNLKNAGEIVRNLWKLHFDPTPQDILTEIYDEYGNLRQVSIPNVAKWRDIIWRDAQSAMYKEFYVDQINGSDTTGDGSQGNPFKTIQRAVNSIPVSGAGEIHLLSDYVGGFVAQFKKLIIVVEPGKSWTIPMGQRCDVSGSQVMIINHGHLIVDRGDGSNITPDNYAGFWVNDHEGVATLGMTTNLYISSVNTTNPVRVDTDRALFGSRYWGLNQNIQMNLAIYNIYCDGDFIVDGLIMKLQNGCGSFQWNNASNKDTFRIVDSSGSPIDVTTKIAGVIKDTNGVPRNLLSNLVF